MRAAGGEFLSFRAERRELRLWGQELAVLLYSGPLAEDQWELNNGRYSLITIPRNPAAEILFLEREVWPALGSPFLSTGGLRDLAPETVLPPDDPRLPRLEQNLLRAAWYALARELGAVSSGRGALAQQSAFSRLQEKVISAGENNGFIHESQHALDEAHKVHPERFQRPFADAAEAEVRATLAALAHSEHPHYALYYAMRQYRQRLFPYQEAVQRVLQGLVAEILRRPRDAPPVRVERNIMLQLPRLPAAILRERAAQAMEMLFAAADRRAGYRLEYARHEPAQAGLRVGALRGEIRPEDLPPVAEIPGEAAVFWRIDGRRVETAGMHVYLADAGVQVARTKAYGLALSGGGYLAAHARLPGGAGPWILELTGGRFEADATSGEQMPVMVLAGRDERPVVLQPLPGGGGIHASLPATFAAEGMLRLIVIREDSPGPPAFVTGLRLLESGEDPAGAGRPQAGSASSSERENSASSR